MYKGIIVTEFKDYLPWIAPIMIVIAFLYTLLKDRRQDKATRSAAQLQYSDTGQERTLKYAFELVENLRNDIQGLRENHKECQRIIKEYEEALQERSQRLHGLEEEIRQIQSGRYNAGGKTLGADSKS